MTKDSNNGSQIRLFTIGFAQKSAQEFFRILQSAGVCRIVDVRLNNVSQLAGYTKKADLEYFLQEIAGISYVHVPDLAPTKDILDAYRKKNLSWIEFEEQFLSLLVDRKTENLVTKEGLNCACLLCSEPKADKCHRRLVAEHLARVWGNVKIKHL